MFCEELGQDLSLVCSMLNKSQCEYLLIASKFSSSTQVSSNVSMNPSPGHNMYMQNKEAQSCCCDRILSTNFSGGLNWRLLKLTNTVASEGDASVCRSHGVRSAWWGQFRLWLHLRIDPYSSWIAWLKIWWCNHNPYLLISYYLRLVVRLAVHVTQLTEWKLEFY